MSYLGNSPTYTHFESSGERFSGTGAKTVFTLARRVTNAFDLHATISNAMQDPFTAYSVAANTVSGTSDLTFTVAPALATNNIVVVYQTGQLNAWETVKAGDILPGAVGSTAIADGAVTNAKLAATTGTGAVVLTTSPTISSPTITTSLTIPSGNTAQRPASPATGSSRYNTTIGNVEYWSGSLWYGITGVVIQGTTTQKAIFGYGLAASNVSLTNLVSNTGVVATDTTGVGTARRLLAAAGYGGDKAIFGYGTTGSDSSLTNLVSNTGVVATDTSGVGTARHALGAAGYGIDKAIFGYGTTGSFFSLTNLVSNTGVVASDTTGVGTARANLAAAGYGGDKALFGYGTTASPVSLTNLVSNTGVVASDTTGVGTERFYLAAAGYGGDKAIFGYGYNGTSNVSLTNLVSNTGVVASDTTGVGTARRELAAAGYGGDKAIFGYGYNGVSNFSLSNLVSNTGVVATDTTGVGTERNGLAAAGYSST